MNTMNKVSLITGASRGLGAELAGFLAKQGYDLVLTARGAEALEETARSLEKHGGKVLALPGDVSDPEHRRQLVRASTSVFGRLDLLINNASLFMLPPPNGPIVPGSAFRLQTYRTVPKAMPRKAE